jgi:hypothetical protein
MSSHKVEETETHRFTTAGTTTIETLDSPPLRPRGVHIAAGLAVFAAVALTPWLLSTSSQTENDLTTPNVAAASPQQAARAQASAGRSYAPNIDPLAGYALFCQNNPLLCALPEPTRATGYIQFCWNSPTLCLMPRLR